MKKYNIKLIEGKSKQEGVLTVKDSSLVITLSSNELIKLPYNKIERYNYNDKTEELDIKLSGDETIIINCNFDSYLKEILENAVNNIDNNYIQDDKCVKVITNNKESDKGNPIHVYTRLEAFLWVFVPAAIIAVFTSIGTPYFIPMWIAETLAGTLLLFFFKFLLRIIGILPEKISDYSFNCICPYCNTKVWFKVPNLRNTCPNCNEDIGLKDGMVYKITKANEKEFKTEQEKTNDILEKNVKNRSNSNLDELKKLKELLDSGAITKEEFEKEKKKLLK